MAYENDMYNFSQPSHLLSTANLDQDETFQKAALQTAAGRRPPTLTSHGRKPTTSMRSLGTAGMGVGSASDVRPMTSVKAAGYRRNANSYNIVSSSNFDPMSGMVETESFTSRRNSGNNSQHDERKVSTMEEEVQKLLDQSIEFAAQKDFSKALEKAREAGQKERAILRHREANNLMETASLDLTFQCCLNLGLQYENNEMPQEAITAYRALTQNKKFENVGRIKVNMGNICFKQKDYQRAIRYYQMALDQVTSKYKMLRIKIMSNIGVSYLTWGKYNEAITAFEHIMNEKPDYPAGFQLIVAYAAQNEVDKMKQSFKKMLDINLGVDLDDHRYQLTRDTPAERAYIDAIKNDALREQERKRIQTARFYVTAAAKLIAPKISSEDTGIAFGKGFDWCVEEVKASKHLAQLSNELEVEKALALLRAGLPKEAEKLLKAFEKREDTPVRAQAMTNLSFVYFQQQKFQLADKFAELALQADRYSPAALVNKGNVLFQKKEYEEAHAYYQQAMNIDATCTEAQYNSALLQFEMGNYEIAADTLSKLNVILPGQPNVLYLLALTYQHAGDQSQASHWLTQCASVVPNDPGVLQAVGRNLAAEGDQSQAFSYHYDSQKTFPGDLGAIEWLGHYYLESQFPEKALNYFERAVVIQPNEIRWHLFVVMCLNRAGAYPKAYDRLKRIHVQFPDSLETLQRLVRITGDMKMPNEAREYEQKMKRLQKQQEAIKQNRVTSGRIRSGGTSRGRVGSGGRAGSGGGFGRSPSNSGGHAAGNRSYLPPSGAVGGPNFAPPPQQLHSGIGPSRPANDKSSAHYDDPIGPSISTRPRTARNKNAAMSAMQDDIHDFDATDLLPD